MAQVVEIIDRPVDLVVRLNSHTDSLPWGSTYR